MNWERWDIITLGRVAGVLIILAGLAATIWEIADFEQSFGFGTEGLTEFRIRYFIRNMASYVGSGGLLILAAEVASRLAPSIAREELFASDGDEDPRV